MPDWNKCARNTSFTARATTVFMHALGATSCGKSRFGSTPSSCRTPRVYPTGLLTTSATMTRVSTSRASQASPEVGDGVPPAERARAAEAASRSTSASNVGGPTFSLPCRLPEKNTCGLLGSAGSVASFVTRTNQCLQGEARPSTVQAPAVGSLYWLCPSHTFTSPGCAASRACSRFTTVS